LFLILLFDNYFMARIVGIELPNEKRIDIGLTAIFGIGRKRAGVILAQAGVKPTIRVKDLSGEEITKIQKTVESFAVEGDLRKQTRENIDRLRSIGSYRGIRHNRGLPTRGQRTKSNARTRRGKRKTIGALKKEDAAKVEKAAAPAATK
jgi:small subunit ribosomal protein S13